MNTEQWTKWLRGWLERHPLKEPPRSLQTHFVEEVMTRIRSAQTPAPVFRWVPQPRFGLALGTAAVCGVLMAVLVGRSSDTVIRQVTHDAQTLLESGEFAMLNGSDFEEEVKENDQLQDELNEIDEMELAV